MKNLLKVWGLEELAPCFTHFQDTPEELQELFQVVDEQVKGLQHETMIQIRTNVIPLGMYIQEAKVGIIQNITDAAASYWTTIKSLQDSAEAQGQNISECIDIGNNELFALNNSIANSANYYIDFYNQSGNDMLNYAATEAYSVVHELIALGPLVSHCNDETCATDLKKIVTQFYARGKATLIDAETKARNYVLVYLPQLLALQQLDSDSYVANYTVFLSDVTNCINNL